MAVLEFSKLRLLSGTVLVRLGTDSERLRTFINNGKQLGIRRCWMRAVSRIYFRSSHKYFRAVASRVATPSCGTVCHQLSINSIVYYVHVPGQKFPEPPALLKGINHGKVNTFSSQINCGPNVMLAIVTARGSGTS